MVFDGAEWKDWRMKWGMKPQQLIILKTELAAIHLISGWIHNLIQNWIKLTEDIQSDWWNSVN